MFSQLAKFTMAALFMAAAPALATNVYEVPAIKPGTASYNEYMSIISNADKGNDGLNDEYIDFNNFNVAGRIVPVRDGLPENPYNIVILVNGRLFYVDLFAHALVADRNGIRFKIRRRLANNPEPGVFIRLEIVRLNPDSRRVEPTQVWLKVAGPEGRVLPVMKVLEGNFDLP